MKIKVYMQSGEEYEIEVDDYNAAELNEQRNNNDIQGILLGDYSLSKINIRDVVPIEEPGTEEPETIKDPAENDEEKQ